LLLLELLQYHLVIHVHQQVFLHNSIQHILRRYGKVHILLYHQHASIQGAVNVRDTLAGGSEEGVLTDLTLE
jgi:hypothetical protein